MADEELTTYEIDEYAIKEAFRETFSENYLAHMRSETFGGSIDEVLYMAFAHGWIAKSEEDQ